MSKEAYIVWVGRKPGVYDSWAACKKQVDGFPGCRFKGYKSQQEAQDAWERGFKSYEKARLKPRLGRKKAERRAKAAFLRGTKDMHGDVLQAARQRARSLVKGSHGSHYSTCVAANCTFPKCQCK